LPQIRPTIFDPLPLVERFLGSSFVKDCVMH
jgi:hypothetical protein